MLGEVWGSPQPGLHCPYFQGDLGGLRWCWQWFPHGSPPGGRRLLQFPSWWPQTPPQLSPEAAALAVRFGLGPAAGLLLTSGPARTGSNQWAAVGGSPHSLGGAAQSHACEVLNLQLVCSRLPLYIEAGSSGGRKRRKRKKKKKEWKLFFGLMAAGCLRRERPRTT